MNYPKKNLAVKLRREESYRVEGLGRHGGVKFVKVVGSPGAWRISGVNGLRIEVEGRTVHDALRRARRSIPFRPIVVRRTDFSARAESMPEKAGIQNKRGNAQTGTPETN
ncbi:MAG: hypothetical protein WCK47_07400 [bacterium]|nr:hypothetical protein [Candidatus Sumerlaeota bacterium]